MDWTTVYAKTAKGVMELSGKSKRLPRDLARVLQLVDGKVSAAEMLTVSGKISEMKLNQALDSLHADGYVKVLMSGRPSQLAEDFGFPATIGVSEANTQAFLDAQAAAGGRAKAIAEKQAWNEELADLKQELDQELQRDADKAAAARIKTEEAEQAVKAKLSAQEEAKAKIRLAEKFREEAEKKARADADASAKREADARAKNEEAQKVKAEAESRARAAAEDRLAAKTREEAEAEAARKTAAEAKAKAKAAAEMNAREQAISRAEAEQQAYEAAQEIENEKKRTEERLRKRLEARAKEEAEIKARAEAAERIRLEKIERPKAEEAVRVLTETEAQRRAEAEAKAGVRAKAEAEKTAQAAAEKQARLDAEHKASAEADMQARVAAEVRAREEAESKAQAEAAARIKAETEAKIKEAGEAVARAKAEAEATARLETEQKSRELAEARTRAEAQAKAEAKAEEEERRKAEARAIALAEIRAREEERQSHLAEAFKPKRKPVKWVKPFLISLVALPVMAIGLLHVITLNFYLPDFEKMASDRLHEPVSIRTVRGSLWPAPHLQLEGVVIGNLRDVKIDAVRVFPDMQSLFGDSKILKAVEGESVALDQDALPRTADWLMDAKPNALQVNRIVLNRVNLAVKDMQLPVFDVAFNLAENGKLKSAVVKSSDNKLTAGIAVQGEDLQIEFAGKNWQLPLGPELMFDEIHGKAVATRHELRIGEIEGRLYGGTAKGAAKLAWEHQWDLTGEFSVAGLGLKESAPLFSKDISLEGLLDARATYALQSQAPARLFNAPRLQAAFNIVNGKLGNMDLVRAIQSTAATEISGGQMRFEKLSGVLSLASNHYQLKSMTMSAGLLSANGYAEVTQDHSVSGRISAELGNNAARNRAKMIVSGSVGEPVLRKGN